MPRTWVVRLNRNISLFLTLGTTEHVFGFFGDSSVQYSTDDLVDVLVITSFQDHNHWHAISVAVVGGLTEFNFGPIKSLTTAFALIISEKAHGAGAVAAPVDDVDCWIWWVVGLSIRPRMWRVILARRCIGFCDSFGLLYGKSDYNLQWVLGSIL